MISDNVLKAAAMEADSRILAQLPTKVQCEHCFSPQFEYKMNQLLKKQKKPRAAAFYKQAAAVVVLVLLIASVVLMAVPDARAAFRGWVKTIYEGVTSFSFIENSKDVQIVDSSLTWLPEGYQEASSIVSETHIYKMYENETENWIVFLCSKGNSSENTFFENGTNVQRKIVDVNGILAELYLSAQADGVNAIIWLSSEADILCSVSASLSEEELIHIAEEAYVTVK